MIVEMFLFSIGSIFFSWELFFILVTAVRDELHHGV